MLYKIIVAFCCLIPLQAFGDIKINQNFEPHEPIVATCELENVDDLDIIYEWTINLDPSQYRYLNNGQCIHIWAKPGTYDIGCTAVIPYKK